MIVTKAIESYEKHTLSCFRVKNESNLCSKNQDEFTKT
ncbi:hypothetical protein DF16_orf05081 [Bacillus thuringiensis serovar kurstaki str. YBT-1520]|nr:hypothetical protein HD73_1176 [Bacillus thuringiensis serovar kurstaki str. HD73]AIM33496.1 hypothetical protein DF16_orf05081 [Bacillus thuringiensis serovar kurstaki str. YBT-1520]EEL57426.1 hypothetical protein bcere0023_10000 [Bacillus cereus Rock4-2]EEL66303.1 hypothetical protein bcere0025_8900 [Bacillus cereus F65185]EEM54715.1 hypothetical protein bthur0006_9140 [Bacillus thuringiensis serovar kurstaki str. T03a001]KEH51084.1 hypothetical protein BG09_0274 [Bacillus thuringiensis s